MTYEPTFRVAIMYRGNLCKLLAEFSELFTLVIERNNPLLMRRAFEVFNRPIYTCLIRLF